MVDLDGGTVAPGLESSNSEVLSVENATARGPRSKVMGSAGPNTILVGGCDGAASGRQGNDRLILVNNRFCTVDVRLTGGAGADTVIESDGDDLLDGGSGHDIAKGRMGDDTC